MTTRSSWRRVTAWLASPRLAVVLLLVVGLMSFVGTLVPQGRARDTAVIAWGAAHPAYEPMVSAVGLHQTFASPLFILTVLLLAASTGVCALGRTKVAMRRHRLLTRISDEEAQQLLLRPTFGVELHGDSPAVPEQTAADALRKMGLRPRERDGLVVAGSRPWAVLGSPVFHWSLLLLMLIILTARLTRAEGLMGVAVGEPRPLSAESFGFLDKGRLYGFSAPPDLIRIDRVDLTYLVGGIDRGPAPTVSIVRPDGTVAKSQIVYPNRAMRYGSRIIHRDAIGLSPVFALVSSSGAEEQRTSLIVDFDDKSPSGTGSAGFTLAGISSGYSIPATVTVPLMKRDGEFFQGVPDPPRATFTLGSAAGGPPQSSTLLVGQEIPLPNGTKLRLVGVGYYARLSVVDDPSIPLVYAFLVLALVAVSISILGGQTLAVIAVRHRPDGTRTLDVWFRDWRAGTVRAEQAEEVIREALVCAADKTGEGT